MDDSSGDTDVGDPAVLVTGGARPKLDAQRRTVSLQNRTGSAHPVEIMEDCDDDDDDVPARIAVHGGTGKGRTAVPASILKKTDPRITIRQHYYPEGGWGWVVVVCAFCAQILSSGLLLSYGVLYVEVLRQFGYGRRIDAAWLGAVSIAIGFFLSPLIVAVCRQRSIRLTAVFGGLVSALGCLFTSFASQFHQVALSYSVVLAIGLGIVKETASLMTGQYFKRKREKVELVVLSGIGVGISLCSALLRALIRSIRWRLGLHAVTGVIFLLFFLGIFYRSASLYHPQRRAILHLKNQRRKVKDKNPQPSDNPPLMDFSTLRTRTLRIVMLSAALCSFGLYTPTFYLVSVLVQVYIAEEEGIPNTCIYLLQLFLGLAFALGCCAFGFLVVKSSSQCLIARQYLCQASIYGLALAILALCALEGYHGYVLFVWVYGIFCGGFHYSLKMFVFEKVRARNFNRAWGFVQWSQAVPVAVGIPVTGYINAAHGPKVGLYFSTACLFAGGTALFLMNCRRKGPNPMVQDSTRSSETGDSVHQDPYFVEDDICTCGNNVAQSAAPASAPVRTPTQRAISFATSVDIVDDDRRGDYLTCISEEGLLELGDKEFPEEWLGADYITSCNNQEMYLMFSEMDSANPEAAAARGSPVKKTFSPSRKNDQLCSHLPKRTMTVIEEVTSTL